MIICENKVLIVVDLLRRFTTFHFNSHTKKRKKIKCKLRNFNSLWGRRNAVASAPPSAFAAAFVYDSFAHSTSSDRVHATTTTTLAFDSIYSDFFCSSHQLLLINIAVIQLQLGGLRHFSLQLFRLDLNTTPHIHTWKLRQKTRPSTTGGGWKVAAKKSFFFISATNTEKTLFDDVNVSRLFLIE